MPDGGACHVDYPMLMKAADIAVRRAAWAARRPLPAHELEDVRSRLMVRVFTSDLHLVCRATTVGEWVGFLFCNARWALADHCRHKAKCRGTAVSIEAVSEEWVSSGPTYDIDGLLDLRRTVEEMPAGEVIALAGLARGDSGRELAALLGTDRFQASRLTTSARRALLAQA